MYLLIGTVSGPAFSVRKLALFCKYPTKIHWNGMKGILRYIKGTLNPGICFSGRDEVGFQGYSDSDWAGDVSVGKSTSGYIL